MLLARSLKGFGRDQLACGAQNSLCIGVMGEMIAATVLGGFCTLSTLWLSGGSHAGKRAAYSTTSAPVGCVFDRGVLVCAAQ